MLQNLVGQILQSFIERSHHFVHRINLKNAQSQAVSHQQKVTFFT